MFISFLKSWLEKNLVHLKKTKLKFGRSRGNKAALFFSYIATNLTDTVGVKKCIIGTELEQLFSVFHYWCMKPVVLANTLGKQAPQSSLHPGKVL